MFPVSKKNSQAGFSLVELMVVVAIIGILAAIAVPNMQKYMAKSRQSEAKTNLASLYTSEKAFFAEYNVYDPRLAAVGFTPEGRLRYNLGFSGGVNATAANGYTATPAIAAINAQAYCTAAGATICSVLVGAGGAAVPAITAAPQTAVAFTAGAAAQIVAAPALVDRWTINQSKIYANPSNGIP